MYGLAGERRLDERVLDWLPGYEGSCPVRTGNAASDQLQLDVYGEVIDALYQARRDGAPADDNIWSLATHVLEWLEDGWRLEDSGIWEVRGPPRHFTHSKVMAWVAFDRAVRAHDEFGREGPIERWRAIRDEIHAEVLARGWSEKQQSFVQSFDSEELDASALIIPLVGFLAGRRPASRLHRGGDPARAHHDGFVLRYRTQEDGDVDGLPPGEGVFLACSFWLVEVLALQGRREEAQELFERLLALRNDVGLLAEEYDPQTGRQLGNFPQAFTHLALVEAALALGGRARDARARVSGHVPTGHLRGSASPVARSRGCPSPATARGGPRRSS